MFAAGAFAASNVIQYTYDAAGNITNIARQPSGGLAITSFSPTSGPTGTAVTIYGMGFSATPANNAVTFNGTAATVTASDSGSIATTVPAGATTGTIAVTVGASTATSAQSFVVTVAGAPTITTFTPAIGASGTSVSVTGTNFNATSGATTFKLNGVAGTGNATSTTAGSFAIPSAASSGRISATTSVGTGTSTTDFIVPPTGLVASDIESSIRISAGGGNASISVGTVNKSALVLFEGAVNGWYSLHFKALDMSPTSASVAYKIIKPDNTVLMSGTRSMSQPTSLHLPKLTAGGTYSLLLSPGSATLQTQVRLEANSAVTVDGAAVPTAMDYPLQTTRFTFDATAGQRLGVGIKGVTFVPYGSNSTSTVYKPDGTTLGYTSPSCFGSDSANTAGNCAVGVVAPVAGTYTIIVDSSSSTYYYTRASVQLSSPVTGTLAADVTQSVSLTRVGQHAAYTFTVASGNSFGIDTSNVAFAPQSGPYTVDVLNPDGSNRTSCSGNEFGGTYCDLGSNMAAGTYTVVVKPAYGAYGTFNLTLKSGPTLTTTGAATSFAPAVAAEAARVQFTATAGQNLNIGVAGLTYVGSGSGNSYLSVYRPDGSAYGGVSCSPAFANGYCRFALSNLPAGTYGIALRPPADAKASGTFTLSADITGALTLGTPVSINAARVGQGAIYTFTATAGDSVALEMYGVSTTPTGQTVSATLYQPDGGYYTYMSTATTSWLNFNSVPYTGTWKLVIDTGYGYPWQAQLKQDAGTSMSINGTTVSLSASSADQPLRYSFSGTSGALLEMGISGLTYAASSSSTTAYVLQRPDGWTWSGNCAPSTAGSCELSIDGLPNTGTYVLLLRPPTGSTITGGTLAFSTPQTGTFVIGDPAQTIAIARPGQTARYTFSGTASQTLRLNWSSTTVAGTGSVSVTVLTAGGSTVSSSSFANGATGGFDIAALPSTGTYTVVIDPPSGTTMSGSFSLVTR